MSVFVMFYIISSSNTVGSIISTITHVKNFARNFQNVNITILSFLKHGP